MTYEEKYDEMYLIASKLFLSFKDIMRLKDYERKNLVEILKEQNKNK